MLLIFIKFEYKYLRSILSHEEHRTFKICFIILGLKFRRTRLYRKRWFRKNSRVVILSFLEESEGKNLFFVIEKCKNYSINKDGRVILAMLNAGDFFGEMSLLDGESRSANVIALEDTEVLSLNRDDFLDVLKDYPKIAIQLLKEMTSKT